MQVLQLEELDVKSVAKQAYPTKLSRTRKSQFSLLYDTSFDLWNIFLMNYSSVRFYYNLSNKRFHLPLKL